MSHAIAEITRRTKGPLLPRDVPPMLATDQSLPEITLPALDVRVLVRRGAVPALLAAAAAGFVLLSGGTIHAFAEAARRVLDVSPGWAVIGVAFEAVSMAGYIGLLSLVAGDVAPRIGVRASAQITLTGAAATRLLPTAGAGGAAVTVWALQRAGLRPRGAARALLAFFVLLYSVFLASLVLSGLALTLGLVNTRGPLALSLIPSAAAGLAIAMALVLAVPRSRERACTGSDPIRRTRLHDGAQLIGNAVRDALGLVRSRDSRLAGAIAYWMFDAAVLWSMLHAFGAPPSIPIVALAYLLGQVANTIPLPGTVSGGMAGVLIAFGVPVGLALPSVLAYRTVAVWLPTPAAFIAMPGLRSTIARWAREDRAAPRDA